jgi:hypothetical protein
VPAEQLDRVVRELLAGAFQRFADDVLGCRDPTSATTAIRIYGALLAVVPPRPIGNARGHLRLLAESGAS